jgi:hypothetical protein
MTRIRMIIVVIGMLLIGVNASAAGTSDDIYKWVDAKGQVHYGSVPPLGVNATIVHADGAPSESAVSEAQAINKTIEQAVTTSGTPPANPVNAEAKQAACDNAKAEYEKIVNTPRVATTNEQGNSELLDENKRQALVDEKQAAANKACAP